MSKPEVLKRAAGPAGLSHDLRCDVTNGRRLIYKKPQEATEEEKQLDQQEQHDP